MTPSLAELAAILTTQPIYPQYSLLMHLNNITITFHTLHISVSSMIIIYITTQLLTTLQLELSKIQGIYQSSKTTITSAVNLLNSNQLQTGIRHKRSLLPFLGTALRWLTGTTTTKDIHSIKTRINQLIAAQSLQCNTLVHIVSILNVTRYATQVNRHSINNLIDAVCTTSQDINNLYNLTTSLAASINFNQMILHIRSVFANLQDSLHYLCTVSTHTMDYVDAAT